MGCKEHQLICRARVPDEKELQLVNVILTRLPYLCDGAYDGEFLTSRGAFELEYTCG